MAAIGQDGCAMDAMVGFFVLYDIKAGTASDDEKAELSASVLFSIVAVDDRRKAEQLFRASDKRANLLSPETLRFVATAEHVAGFARADSQLHMSPKLCNGSTKHWSVTVRIGIAEWRATDIAAVADDGSLSRKLNCSVSVARPNASCASTPNRACPLG